MQTEGQLRVTLVIDRDDQPITGWLESPSGGRRPFVGMLELIGVLERLREAPAGSDLWEK